MSQQSYAFIAIFGWLILQQVNQNYHTPLLVIVLRWYRWLVIAGITAMLCRDFELLERPFWVLYIASFFTWSLIEIFYNWISVNALSRSSLPLFPHFSVNPAGQEWPIDPRFLKLKERIQKAEFRYAQSLKTELAPGIFLRIAIYQDFTNATRLEVIFIPHSRNVMQAYLSFSTYTEKGTRYLTDNMFLPFGGFYPETWRVQRNPRTASFENLLATHQKRVRDSREKPTALKVDAQIEINDHQRELERLNTEYGFLFPPAEHQEFGRISQEGRYRIWVEMFFLSYFGVSRTYK